MKLLTPQQMKAIDESAIKNIGIPGIILMENAAIQTVMKASQMLSLIHIFYLDISFPERLINDRGFYTRHHIEKE